MIGTATVKTPLAMDVSHGYAPHHIPQDVHVYDSIQQLIQIRSLSDSASEVQSLPSFDATLLTTAESGMGSHTILVLRCPAPRSASHRFASLHTTLTRSGEQTQCSQLGSATSNISACSKRILGVRYWKLCGRLLESA